MWTTVLYFRQHTSLTWWSNQPLLTRSTKLEMVRMRVPSLEMSPAHTLELLKGRKVRFVGLSATTMPGWVRLSTSIPTLTVKIKLIIPAVSLMSGVGFLNPHTIRSQTIYSFEKISLNFPPLFFSLHVCRVRDLLVWNILENTWDCVENASGDIRWHGTVNKCKSSKDNFLFP